jgi:hypothetical protein
VEEGIWKGKLIMKKTSPVELVSLDGKKASGEVTTEHWETKERSKRAFKILGILWGIALFSVIIPGLHFILVPSFLLAGPITAFFTYQQSDAVLGGKGTCPDCGKPFEVARMKIKWPLDDVCANCHAGVKIYLKSV